MCVACNPCKRERGKNEGPGETHSKSGLVLISSYKVWKMLFIQSTKAGRNAKDGPLTENKNTTAEKLSTASCKQKGGL